MLSFHDVAYFSHQQSIERQIENISIQKYKVVFKLQKEFILQM